MSIATPPHPDIAASRPVLVEALLDPHRYPHPVGEIRLLETHISWVLLTGTFAYKIKKPVDLGFLDFSTLAKRRFYCEEELRLNRRLLPARYLAVVGIGGTPDDPQLREGTTAIEYAVKMRQFPQGALFDRLLSTGKLLPQHIDALADQVASFHTRVAQVASGNEYGSPETVRAPIAQNFDQLRAHFAGDDTLEANKALFAEVETWSLDKHARLREVLARRQRDGFVRECHGDLHLGNIALIDGTPEIFDCIEFSPGLRWIDVMSEIAFITMDLESRGRRDFSQRFLNRYLEATGDYAGLRVLAYYQGYRAIVRANVARIRASQADPQEAPIHAEACLDYLRHAQRLSQPRARRLLLMHGVSGSGKTWLSQFLIEQTGAVRLRSDVERKRQHGAEPGTLYAAETTHATYRRLVELARLVLEAGFPVVIDAANLKIWQRAMFRRLARSQGVAFHILACTAPEPVLHRRLVDRAAAGTDASDADIDVLRQQLADIDPLSSEEQTITLWFDAGQETPDQLLPRLDAEKAP